MIARVFIPVMLAVLASMLPACLKKKDEARTKDIEALVSGDETNRRQHEYCGAGEPTAGATAEEALATVYARLPARFTRELPALKDHILLEDEAVVRDTCKSVFKDQAAQLFTSEAEQGRALARLENLGACWTLKVAETMDATPVPTIHVARSQDAIHGNLIAMVTYAVMELYIDQVGETFAKMTEERRGAILAKLEVTDKEAAETSLLDFLTKLPALRDRLAKAVYNDLVKTGRMDTLEQYRVTYGLADVADVATSPLTRNLFFAEAIDSYYCSAKTRSDFQLHELDETWAVMQEIAAFLAVD